MAPTLFAGRSKRVDLKLVSRLELASGAMAMRYAPETQPAGPASSLQLPVARIMNRCGRSFRRPAARSAPVPHGGLI